MFKKAPCILLHATIVVEIPSPRTLQSEKPNKLVIAEIKLERKFLFPSPVFFKTLGSRVVIYYFEGLNWFV